MAGLGVLDVFLILLFQAEAIEQAASNTTTFGKNSVLFELEAFKDTNSPDTPNVLTHSSSESH